MTPDEHKRQILFDLLKDGTPAPEQLEHYRMGPFSEFSDREAAYAVRTLAKNQLNYDAVLTLGRDRIMTLSYENERLRSGIISILLNQDDGDIATRLNELLGDEI